MSREKRMDEFVSDQSLAEIVSRVDGAAAVLERFGLDSPDPGALRGPS